MLVEFSQLSLLGKARSQPEKVSIVEFFSQILIGIPGGFPFFDAKREYSDDNYKGETMVREFAAL